MAEGLQLDSPNHGELQASPLTPLPPSTAEGELGGAALHKSPLEETRSGSFPLAGLLPGQRKPSSLGSKVCFLVWVCNCQTGGHRAAPLASNGPSLISQHHVGAAAEGFESGKRVPYGVPSESLV